MDGLSLARRLVVSHPHMALVFASGYGSLVAGASNLAACVLTKPFTDLQLKQAVLVAVAHASETSDKEANTTASQA